MKISITATHVLLAMSMASPIAMAAPIAVEEVPEARDQVQSGTELDSTEWIGRGAGGYPGGMVNDRPHEGEKRSETSARIEARGQAGGYPGGMVYHNPLGEKRDEAMHARGQAGGYPGGMINDGPHSGEKRSEASGTNEARGQAGGYPGGMINDRPHDGEKRDESFTSMSARDAHGAGGYPGGMVNDNPHGQERSEFSGSDESVQERSHVETVNKLDQQGIDHIFGRAVSPREHKRSLEELIEELHQRKISEQEASASTMAERQAELAVESEGKREEVVLVPGAGPKREEVLVAPGPNVKREDGPPASSSDVKLTQEEGVKDLAGGATKASQTGENPSPRRKKGKKGKKRRHRKNKELGQSPYGDHAEDVSHFALSKKPHRLGWAEDASIKAPDPFSAHLHVMRREDVPLSSSGANVNQERGVTDLVEGVSKVSEVGDKLSDHVKKKAKKRKNRMMKDKKPYRSPYGDHAEDTSHSHFTFWKKPRRPDWAKDWAKEDSKKKGPIKATGPGWGNLAVLPRSQSPDDPLPPGPNTKREDVVFVAGPNAKREDLSASNDKRADAAVVSGAATNDKRENLVVLPSFNGKREDVVFPVIASSKRDEEVLLSAAPSKRKDEFLPFPTSGKRDDEPSEDILVERGGKHHKCKKLLGHFYRCKTISFDKRDEAALAALKYVRDNEVNASVPATSGKREDEDIVDAINVSRERRDAAGNTWKSIGCALVGFFPRGCRVRDRRDEAAWPAINVERDDPSVPALNGKRGDVVFIPATGSKRDEQDFIDAVNVERDDDVNIADTINKRGNLRCKNLLIVHWCSRKNKKHH